MAGDRPLASMTADTLLMHPALAWANPATSSWTSHVDLPGGAEYTSEGPALSPEDMARCGLTLPGVAEALQRWLVNRRVAVWDTRRGLIDPGARKIWLVDFVCQLGGRCHLLCMFYGTRRVWAAEELAYAQGVRRLARETYRCDARVLAVKVYGGGRVTSREMKEPPQKGPPGAV